MQICYYDEVGGDGYPRYSSPAFVLSVLYLHHLNWKESFDTVLEFRRGLRDDYDFPVKIEMHARQFLLDKNPYKPFRIQVSRRIEILERFCRLIADLDAKFINVVIVKPSLRRPDIDVLDTALKFSVQRVENDLDPKTNPNAKFMIITDDGRVGKMRKTTRRIQRINYIPSKYSAASYRREVRSLIEDPLPKNSKESYFIQLADIVAYIVHLHTLKERQIGDYPNRLKEVLNADLVRSWLDLLKPSLNLKASARDSYGIKYYPE